MDDEIGKAKFYQIQLVEILTDQGLLLNLPLFQSLSAGKLALCQRDIFATIMSICALTRT